jgi:hypothetical protein
MSSDFVSCFVDGLVAGIKEEGDYLKIKTDVARNNFIKRRLVDISKQLVGVSVDGKLLELKEHKHLVYDYAYRDTDSNETFYNSGVTGESTDNPIRDRY